MTPEQQQRFYSQLDKSDPGGCWIWRGPVSHTGTPVTYAGGKTPRSVARIMFQLAGQSPTSGEDVAPSCGSKRCVNPEHLRVTSRRARFRGIVPKPKGKLDAAAVNAIRASSESYAALATRFGVRRTAIGRCRRGKTWQNV